MDDKTQEADPPNKRAKPDDRPDQSKASALEIVQEQDGTEKKAEPLSEAECSFESVDNSDSDQKSETT